MKVLPLKRSDLERGSEVEAKVRGREEEAVAWR